MEVLHHRQIGVQPEPLAHVADALLDPFRFRDHVAARDPGLAAAGVHDGGEQPHRGRLAGPVRPNQTKNLPLGHLERKPIDGRQLAESLGQLVGPDGVHEWLVVSGSPDLN